MSFLSKKQYTPRALLAVYLAKQKAQAMGLPFAGTGHLLLGLAKANGKAAKILATAGVECQAITYVLKKLMQVPDSQSETSIDAIGVSGTVQAAFDYARYLTPSKEWVTDERLLVALQGMCEDYSTATTILRHLGVAWRDLVWDAGKNSGTGKHAGKMINTEKFDLQTTYEDFMKTHMCAVTWNGNNQPTVTSADLHQVAAEEAFKARDTSPVSIDVIKDAAATLRLLSFEIVNLRVMAATNHAVFTGEQAKERKQEFIQATKAAAENECRRLMKLADQLDGKAWDYLPSWILGAFGVSKEVSSGPANVNPDTEAKEIIDTLNNGAIHAYPAEGEKALNDTRKNQLDDLCARMERAVDALSRQHKDVESDACCPQGHHKLEGDCKYDYCRCPCPCCTEQCQKHGR